MANDKMLLCWYAKFLTSLQPIWLRALFHRSVDARKLPFLCPVAKDPREGNMDAVSLSLRLNRLFFFFFPGIYCMNKYSPSNIASGDDNDDDGHWQWWLSLSQD